MKKKLLLLLALVTGAFTQTHATHDIGGSLTYQCVAPGIFVFTYAHYNWGGLTAVPSNTNLILSSPGCSNTRQVAFQQPSPSRIGGYIPPTHGVTSYMITEMLATVVFSPAEVACGTMVANVSIGTGQPAANLSTPGMGGIQQYTETTINLSGTLPAFQNNSPVFDYRNEPVLVASKYQPITLSVAATDQDGDSLVYSLVAPIAGHNQPITNYGSFSATQANPEPQPPFSASNPQFATLPAPNTYSADFPLLSYDANWASGQMFNTATKNFVLDPHSGSLSFTPMLYSSQNNIYLVSFKVDEYRKINGATVNLGSIRRETIIIVAGIGGNQNPKLGNITVNNAPVTQNRTFNLPAGAAFTLEAAGLDANATDSVYLEANVGPELPGATFTVSSGAQPTATFAWTPTAAQVRNEPYYLRIWVKDNASPLAAKRVETFALRVTNAGGVMGVKPQTTATNFYAFPNPFTQDVNFEIPAGLKTREVLIYNLLGSLVDKIAVTDNAGLKWLNAGKYPAGTYVAKLVTEDKTVQAVKFTKVQ